jgi:hypothetical protein
MSNNVRLLIGLLGTAVLAALAVPELSEHLPPGVGPGLAAAIAAVLHKINSKSEETTPDEQ